MADQRIIARDSASNGQTRDEVKAALDERTASISARLEALEDEMPVRPSTLRKISRHKGLIKKGLAAGAALLLIRAVVKRFNKSDSGYDEGIKRIASSITREITRNLNAGMPERDAVESALRKRPPVLNFGSGSSRSSSSGTFTVLLKQLAVTLSPIIIETIVDIIRKGPDGGSAGEEMQPRDGG